MKKLLLTLTDKDEAMMQDLKEIWKEKTETATIRKALNYAYDSKETIQKQIYEDAYTEPKNAQRITGQMIDELDPEAKQILLTEIYNLIMESH